MESMVERWEMNEQQNVILITGCSGRVGTSVIRRFEGKYRIVGFDMVPPKLQYENTEYVQVDLSSDESVKKGLDRIKEKYGNHLVAVIHLAAYYSFSGERPELYQKITVQGTGRILKGIKEFTVEQFLFSSTQLIYAPCEVGQKINENSPVLPKWDYPKSKVETEKLIHEAHGDISTVIFQIAGCYDDLCNSIPISHQIQRIFEHHLDRYFFPGDLTHGAPFLHLNDLAEAIWLAVEKRKQLPQEFTAIIGEDRTMSYDELQRSISQLVDGRPLTTYRIPKWFAKLGAWILDRSPIMKEAFIQPWMIDIADDHYQLDITRAKEFLGWRPKNFVGSSLPKMIKALKADPLGWYQVNDLTAPSWLKKKYERISHGG
jgi:nucleoside-diphosphate-sugar epimerase